MEGCGESCDDDSGNEVAASEESKEGTPKSAKILFSQPFHYSKKETIRFLIFSHVLMLLISFKKAAFELPSEGEALTMESVRRMPSSEEDGKRSTEKATYCKKVFEGGIYYNKVARMKASYLFLLLDIGSGSEGHAMFCCDSNGKVCVVKLFHKSRVSDGKQHRDAEYNAWEEIYGDCKPKVPFAKRTVDGRHALVMPFVRPIAVDARGSLLEEIRNTLMMFQKKGKEHGNNFMVILFRVIVHLISFY